MPTLCEPLFLLALVAAQAAPDGSVPRRDASGIFQAQTEDPPPDYAGSFPGSFRIPGTELSIKFGGRIKADAIHDFDAIGSTDDFKPSTIPVPEVSSDGNTEFHAKDTRIHLEVRSPSELGEVRGYVEGNFFDSDTTFVLRHAYVQTDKLLFGQTWTNFMLIDSRPETLDFEDANGSVFIRLTQIRWTEPVGEEMHWSIALEDPDSDITLPANTTAEQVYPDLTSGLRLDNERGHTYLSGILRSLSYDGASSDSDLGWGASLSGRLDTRGKDNLRFQVAYGHGIARYIEDLRGLGLDAAADGSGDLEALPTYGGFVGYQVHWNDEWRSNFVHSMASIDNSAGQAPTDLHQTSYSAVNLIWKAAERIDVGCEVMHGTRENNDGEDADATRIQFSFIYSF